MKKQMYLIDIFKFFFCLCVIAIHTSLLKNCSDEVFFWTNQCVLRLAVPFFFIVSGFMLVICVIAYKRDGTVASYLK